MSAHCPCGAEIMWCLTENGKAMPLDPIPIADGSVIILRHGEPGDPSVVRVLTKAAREEYDRNPDAPPRYYAHFSTCPRRDDFKGKGKGRGRA